jgi:hypothetical protein
MLNYVVGSKVIIMDDRSVICGKKIFPWYKCSPAGIQGYILMLILRDKSKPKITRP